VTTRVSARGTRRDRADTERRLRAAVGRLLAKRGFAAVGVNAVAALAGVDKVLIYRYFGGLPELLAAYGASAEFWPSAEELLGPDDDAGAGAKANLDVVLAALLRRFVDALQRRPLTLEILAWETVSRNELTAQLEERRERWGEELERRLLSRFAPGRFDVAGLSILLVSALQYLSIRARDLRVYGGIPLREPAGWERIHQVIATTFAAALPAIAPRPNPSAPAGDDD
jgi:AcrR family transcriptional regulator